MVVFKIAWPSLSHVTKRDCEDLVEPKPGNMRTAIVLCCQCPSVLFLSCGNLSKMHCPRTFVFVTGDHLRNSPPLSTKLRNRFELQHRTPQLNKHSVGGSCRLVSLYQNVSRYIQFFMELPNHVQR